MSAAQNRWIISIVSVLLTVIFTATASSFYYGSVATRVDRNESDIRAIGETKANKSAVDNLKEFWQRAEARNVEQHKELGRKLDIILKKL